MMNWLRQIHCEQLRNVYFAYAYAATLLCMAAVVYMIAMTTNWWFTMPPHSFYGLWSVTFCDFLHCQLIPAFGDSPNWYLAVQVLSVLGYTCLLIAIIVVSFFINKRHKHFSVHVWKASGLCVVSATLMSTALVVFYANLLTDSSPRYHPYVSYSSGAACLACLLELCAAALLSKEV